MIKTIIFDFDGTLADCKELHQDAFRRAVKQVCPQAEYDDEAVEGRPTREKIRILNSMGYSFNGDKLNEIKQMITQERLPEFIKFEPALYEQVERLSHRYKLCVASNATEAFINRSLEIMRIRDLFLRINTATDFPAKPDTTTFYDCMRYTGSGPATTAIFEDSPVGIQCATATGARVVEVTDVWDTIEKTKDF
jgi:beta-phosphoglucomutase-like phosphatase (HAD superfamily)